MKVEFELRLLFWFSIAMVSCFAFGFYVGQFFIAESNGAFDSMNCLTATDLNRSDIGAGIVLSRFCEGMGLQSSVLWQQDEQGNTYGIPICVRG